MGNIAKLVLLEEDRSPFLARPVLYEAKNSVPVFWFALFGRGDDHSFELPLSGGSSLPVPGLCAASVAAVERLSRRASLIQSWLPSELHHLFKEFRQEIEREHAQCIGLDPAEVALAL